MCDKYKKTIKKIFIINGSGCVDCDTEFFNGYEWKKISDYNESDKVLQYNKNGTANLVKPNSFIKQRKDYLDLFENKYLNFCYSNDHNCYYITSKGNLYNKSFEEIKSNFNNSKCGFNGKFITAYKIESDSEINLTDAQIKLMISIIADGHFKNDNTNLCYLNLKKERKKAEFRKICQEANIDYTEKQCSSMSVYSRFFVKAPIHEKHFSKKWYMASYRQLKLIAENIVKWDGDCKNRFFTRNKESADFIQYCFSSIGLHSSISVYKDKSNKKVNYVVTKSNNIYFKMSKDNRLKVNAEVVPYKTKDGYEYCFSIPSGMWVMRRNNKICVTGNCVGKDTFISFVSQNADFKVFNFSSVDKVKEIAKIIGWKGEKTEKDRKFLSDLKLLCTNYNDMPLKSIIEFTNIFNESEALLLFIHVREPSEISKVKKVLSKKFNVKTLLIKRNSVKHIISNTADKYVYDYNYDIVIENNGSLEELNNIAKEFIKNYI